MHISVEINKSFYRGMFQTCMRTMFSATSGAQTLLLSAGSSTLMPQIGHHYMRKTGSLLWNAALQSPALRGFNFKFSAHNTALPASAHALRTLVDECATFRGSLDESFNLNIFSIN